MKTLFPPTRYIPTGFVPYVENQLGVVYASADKLKAIAYAGKSAKKVWFYSFRKPEDMEKKAASLMLNLQVRVDSKEQRKLDRKLESAQAREQIKVGDIFHHSWGWEQTQCDFYQVVKLEGGFMYLREIGSQRAGEPTSSMSENRLAVKDAFLTDSAEIRFKVSFHPPFQCGWASLWDGTAKYCSWYA